MDLCKERSLFEPPSTSPLALHEFLQGHKAHSFIVTSSCTYEVTCPSMEEEGLGRSLSCQASGEAQAASRSAQQARSSHPDPIPLGSQSSSQRNFRGPLPRPAEDDHEHHQRGGPPEQALQDPSPYLSARAPPPEVLPDWRGTRRPRLPINGGGSNDKADYIRSWSMGITEHGDEAYCGCGDAPAPPEPTPAPPGSILPAKEKSHVRMIRGRSRVGEPKGSGTHNGQGHQQQGEAAAVTTAAAAPHEAPVLPPARVLCPYCGRPLAPAIAPGDRDEHVWGMSKLAVRVKGAFKRLLGHSQGGGGGSSHGQYRGPGTGGLWQEQAARPEHEENVEGGKENNAVEQPAPGPSQPTPYNGGHRPHQTEQPAFDEEDGDVDPDQLSIESGPDGRPGGGIAEREARLRRARDLHERSHRTIAVGTGAAAGAADG